MTEYQGNKTRKDIDLKLQETELDLFNRGFLTARAVTCTLTPVLLDHLEKVLTGYDWQKTQDHYQKNRRNKSSRSTNLWKSNN